MNEIPKKLKKGDLWRSGVVRSINAIIDYLNSAKVIADGETTSIRETPAGQVITAINYGRGQTVLPEEYDGNFEFEILEQSENLQTLKLKKGLIYTGYPPQISDIAPLTANVANNKYIALKFDVIDGAIDASSAELISSESIPQATENTRVHIIARTREDGSIEQLERGIPVLTTIPEVEAATAAYNGNFAMTAAAVDGGFSLTLLRGFVYTGEMDYVTASGSDKYPSVLNVGQLTTQAAAGEYIYVVLPIADGAADFTAPELTSSSTLIASTEESLFLLIAELLSDGSIRYIERGIPALPNPAEVIEPKTYDGNFELSITAGTAGFSATLCRGFVYTADFTHNADEPPALAPSVHNLGQLSATIGSGEYIFVKIPIAAGSANLSSAALIGSSSLKRSSKSEYYLLIAELLSDGTVRYIERGIPLIPVFGEIIVSSSSSDSSISDSDSSVSDSDSSTSNSDSSTSNSDSSVSDSDSSNSDSSETSGFWTDGSVGFHCELKRTEYDGSAIFSIHYVATDVIPAGSLFLWSNDNSCNYTYSWPVTNESQTIELAPGELSIAAVTNWEISPGTEYWHDGPVAQKRTVNGVEEVFIPSTLTYTVMAGGNPIIYTLNFS